MSPQQHADRVEQATHALNKALTDARRDGVIVKVEASRLYECEIGIADSSESLYVRTRCALALQPSPQPENGASTMSPLTERRR